jgi:N-acetylmuramoyl-L-alanine amidase
MPTQHVIEQGETIASLALQYGFFPNTIWNDSANAELKRNREDPHVLLPGDIVTVPDKRVKEVDKPDKARHRFRRKGVPKTLRVKLVGMHGPRSNLGYRIDIDGKLANGKTDAEGVLKQPIPLDARHAKLVLDNGLEYDIALGDLDPINETIGVQKRLTNLGYYTGPLDGKLSADTTAALKLFQASQALPQSGDADEATKNKLVELNELSEG